MKEGLFSLMSKGKIPRGAKINSALQGNDNQLL